MGWIIPSAADRRLLGTAPLTGPTPWLVAIMSFSILLIAAAGFAIANSASLFTRSVDSRFVVAVPGGDPRLAAMLDEVRQLDGVREAHVVSEQKMRQTLQRWLGPLADRADVPVPSLVTVELEPGGRPQDLRAVVSRFGPGIKLEANRAAIAPLLDSLRALQWVALSMVLMLVLAAAAGIVLAARAALDTHRSTIEVLHGIGATDAQITDLFQRKIAFDALVGSLVGAALAGTVLSIIAAGAAFLGQLTGGATLNTSNLVILAVMPLALTAIALLVSRAAVMSRLKQAL